MKKITACVILLLILCAPECTIAKTVSVVSPGNTVIHAGVHHGNVAITFPNTGVVHHSHHHHDTHHNYVTPPPPPPPGTKYIYDGFAGNRHFPVRSYYVPSYCRTIHDLYAVTNNPFCNHIAPYGSNIYISF